MTSPRFVYDVNVSEILGAPMGRYTYAARILHLERHAADGAVTHPPAPFSECYGESAQAAAKKAHAKMDAWIAMQSVRVEARLVDGGAMDWVFGPEFVSKLKALEKDGLVGRALVHEILTDDWGAPPIVVTVSWTEPTGERVERNINYD